MSGRVCVKGFMDPEEEKHFRGVYLEVGRFYESFWFVWDRDGPFERKDWEPLLLVYNKAGSIAYCVVRPHYSWNEVVFDDLKLSANGCVMVKFIGSFHGPVLRTKTNTVDFDRELRNSAPIYSQPVRLLKEEVPQEARDPSIRLGSIKVTPRVSVDEKIEELVQSL